MKFYYWIIFFTISNLVSSQELKLIVKNIDNNKGNLMIGIYDSPESFLYETYADTLISLESVTDSLTISFSELETHKNYAISIYQDSDKNFKLNTWVFGIPTERYGFSNNARGKMGPPDYKNCKFYFDSDTVLKIKIH